MKTSILTIGCICASLSSWTFGFNLPNVRKQNTATTPKSSSNLLPIRFGGSLPRNGLVTVISSSSAAEIITHNEVNATEKTSTASLVRSQGGRLSFSTKYGALNPFAIYYGLVAIILGIPWFAALSACQFLYLITGGRVDKMRQLPIFFSHLWGVVLGKLTRTIPKFEGKQILERFYKE